MAYTVFSLLRSSGTLALLAAVIPGCAGSDPEEQSDHSESSTTTTAANPAAPPVGPSLWVLIDRSPVPGDADLVQAIARIDPASGQEIDRVTDVGYNPRELTYVDGTLCVHNLGYDSVTCVDPATHATVQRLEFGRSFTSYTRGHGAFWATEVGTGLIRVDAATGARSVLPADLVPTRLTFSEGAVWVANTSMSVTRVDPGTGTTVANIPTRFEDELFMPLDIAAAANAVWVTAAGGRVLRIDPASNEISAALSGAASPTETQVLVGVKTRVVADANAAWVVGLENGTVLRIDAANNAALVAATLEPPVRDIAIGLDAVWVLHGDGGSITRLDPATGAATAVAMVGLGAVGLIAR